MMVTTTYDARSSEMGQEDELFWDTFYQRLRPIVRKYVYAFQVSSWDGQEEDLVNDIIQETIVRAFERAQKVRRGEVGEVQSFKNLTTKIAENYCRDLRRKDWRLCRNPLLPGEPETGACEETPFESAIEEMYQESIFEAIAYEVACFPVKQRQALLIDLANRMSFSTQLTPLQEAFLHEGICLKQYQLSLPMNAQERSRHTALLHCAYQRLARLPRIRAYMTDMAEARGGDERGLSLAA